MKPPPERSRVTMRIPRKSGDAIDLEVTCIQVAVVEGPDAGAHRRVLAERLRLGASAANDLRLTDPAVSGTHAELCFRGERLFLRDLDSTNGTTLRGERVEEAELADGDEFRVGETTLRVTLPTQRRRTPIPEADGLGALVGSSLAMRRLYAMIEAVAPTGATVLVTGETGTGKELVARELHRLSGREGPLVPFDAGATDPGQIASALFGHGKGAFTGAVAARPGAARTAHGGTLFLDEIGELPLELQPRLLRLLEAREVTPLGADTPSRVDLRVVAATHRDLPAAVEAGTFRADLLHRLAVIEVPVPPLRDRAGDLFLLADALAQDQGWSLTWSPAGRRALEAHAWPGNVRELRNRLERAHALAAGGPVGPAELGLDEAVAASPGPAAAPDIPPSPGTPPPTAPEQPAIPPGTSLAELERAAAEAALARRGGDRQAVADELGISLRTLKRRLREYRNTEEA